MPSITGISRSSSAMSTALSRKPVEQFFAIGALEDHLHTGHVAEQHHHAPAEEELVVSKGEPVMGARWGHELVLH